MHCVTFLLPGNLTDIVELRQTVGLQICMSKRCSRGSYPWGEGRMVPVCSWYVPDESIYHTKLGLGIGLGSVTLKIQRFFVGIRYV